MAWVALSICFCRSRQVPVHTFTPHRQRALLTHANLGILLSCWLKKLLLSATAALLDIKGSSHDIILLLEYVDQSSSGYAGHIRSESELLS